MYVCACTCLCVCAMVCATISNVGMYVWGIQNNAQTQKHTAAPAHKQHQYAQIKRFIRAHMKVNRTRSFRILNIIFMLFLNLVYYAKLMMAAGEILSQ